MAMPQYSYTPQMANMPQLMGYGGYFNYGQGQQYRPYQQRPQNLSPRQPDQWMNWQQQQALQHRQKRFGSMPSRGTNKFAIHPAQRAFQKRIAMQLRSEPNRYSRSFWAKRRS